MEGIISLTVEDLRVREMLGTCDLGRLSPKYKEPDLILSTSRALGSIEFVNVHCAWSAFLADASEGPLSVLPVYSAAIRLSLRYDHFNSRAARTDLSDVYCRSSDPEASFLSARYLLRALSACSESQWGSEFVFSKRMDIERT